MNEYVYKEGIDGLSAILAGLILIGLSIFRIYPSVIWCVCLLILGLLVYLSLMKLNIFLSGQIIFKIIYKINFYIFIGLVLCNIIELIFNISFLNCQLVIGLLILFIH